MANRDPSPRGGNSRRPDRSPVRVVLNTSDLYTSVHNDYTRASQQITNLTNITDYVSGNPNITYFDDHDYAGVVEWFGATRKQIQKENNARAQLLRELHAAGGILISDRYAAELQARTLRSNGFLTASTADVGRVQTEYAAILAALIEQRVTYLGPLMRGNGYAR